jgi:hypothetical protein
LFESPP